VYKYCIGNGMHCLRLQNGGWRTFVQNVDDGVTYPNSVVLHSKLPIILDMFSPVDSKCVTDTSKLSQFRGHLM
jgi:hypothetical protein